MRHTHGALPPKEQEKRSVRRRRPAATREGRERYEPYRWQVTDRGLTRDALKVCMREL
ncbi:hypothetical protein QF037_009380 [Streptomyces canus]|uniref:hypothetical protein n=1 Tax=Streptomyces canus TaxID=58343 RepID=UPI0027847341|nr:hypothetical protein [Streptomyces canus]MDQ0605035.1 hypothetical protein [Streptomyces canus]